MKIIAVDADGAVLRQLVSSLSEVFSRSEIVSFTSALSSVRYFTDHRSEVALIYFPLTLRPFDGFKFSQLVEQSSFSGSLVFTTQTDSEEIRELIRLNGANRHIPKPIDPDKIRALATLEQEMCLDMYEAEQRDGCSNCVYHWCGNYKN